VTSFIDSKDQNTCKSFLFQISGYQDVEKTRIESGGEANANAGNLLRKKGFLSSQGNGENCSERKR